MDVVPIKGIKSENGVPNMEISGGPGGYLPFPVFPKPSQIRFLKSTMVEKNGESTPRKKFWWAGVEKETALGSSPSYKG